MLLGSYDPADYEASVVLDYANEIICRLEEEVSTDSLKAYVQRMQDFGTRNTYSDTVSDTRGIGACRRWAYQWFQDLSARRENRLIPSYMDFEMPSSAFCGPGEFRNIFAVLPGQDATDPSVLFIEGHIDSRCEVLCDTSCDSPGAEDNASGSALVMELARVMSQFTFDHTIVFLLTVGEEQGLFGAEAFADWCTNHAVDIKAVQNNDVVGGVICGPSSSPPSCPGEDQIDSTSVRIFSQGFINSIHKDYARFMKTIYQEKVLGTTSVPMTVRLMQPEDRTGRGGDHIPFRENGFRAIRVCAANEHGDANTSSSSYEGRQHTTRDIIGEDTDGDLIIDSFYVDFNYLKRNAVFNGAALTAAALGPDIPHANIYDDGLGIHVEIIDPQHDRYRIGLRSTSNDFDALWEISDTSMFDLPEVNPSDWYRISVAAVDEQGISSLYSREENILSISTISNPPIDTASLSPLDCSTVGIFEPSVENNWPGISLHIFPNPATANSQIEIRSKRKESLNGIILLHNDQGSLIKSWEAPVQESSNLIDLDRDLPIGVYTLSLWINDQKARVIRFVFAEE